MRKLLENRFLTDKSVQERLGLSRSAFYRYLQSGVLAAPLRLIGKNRRGWTEQEVALAKLELDQNRRRQR
jgi:predicted DNA-binding transcriptional regulator AlpA